MPDPAAGPNAAGPNAAGPNAAGPNAAVFLPLLRGLTGAVRPLHTGRGPDGVPRFADAARALAVSERFCELKNKPARPTRTPLAGELLAEADRREELSWPTRLRLAPRRLGPPVAPGRPDALDEACAAEGLAAVPLDADRRLIVRLIEAPPPPAALPDDPPAALHHVALLRNAELAAGPGEWRLGSQTPFGARPRKASEAYSAARNAAVRAARFDDELLSPHAGVVLARLDRGTEADPRTLARWRAVVVSPEQGRRLVVRPIVDEAEQLALGLVVAPARRMKRVSADDPPGFAPMRYAPPADPVLARLERRLLFARGVEWERYWLAVDALRTARLGRPWGPTADVPDPVAEADRVDLATERLAGGGMSLMVWGVMRDRFRAAYRRAAAPALAVRAIGGNP